MKFELVIGVVSPMMNSASRPASRSALVGISACLHKPCHGASIAIRTNCESSTVVGHAKGARRNETCHRYEEGRNYCSQRGQMFLKESEQYAEKSHQN
jgi:hypothetical protein